jgi:hypothetical protein
MMIRKAFAVISFLTVSAAAQASGITPPIPYNPIAPSETLEEVGYVPAKLLSVETEALCPAGVTCFANGTVAKLSFEIPCAGRLVEPIEYHVVTNKKFESTVYVRATGVVTKRSLAAFCSPGFSKTVDLTLINTYVSPENFIDIGAQLAN